MKTLQIEESKARTLYKSASSEFKTMLEDTFGKGFFSQKVTERIKTYEDACRELNINPIDETTLTSNGFTKDEIVYRKIKTITEALNEGWQANWNDENQNKWTPYFYPNSPSGFVFYDTDYGYSDAVAAYGVRLCFKSDELATYAGKQFVDLYKEFIL
jgi:hypothetical protein|nr:MAG TPA: hypothetical protein [Caudoviricetes sp.]